VDKANYNPEEAKRRHKKTEKVRKWTKMKTSLGHRRQLSLHTNATPSSHALAAIVVGEKEEQAQVEGALARKILKVRKVAATASQL
jgi:hypothetical protein